MSKTSIALISEHANPLARLGGVDAGGQNVYIGELSQHLAHIGHSVDIFTRRDAPTQPAIVEWMPGVRVIHLSVGPSHHLPKAQLWPLMPQFRDALLTFIQNESVRYDVVHGNYWMSGWVAAELGRLCHLPTVQLFHAIGTTRRRFLQQGDTSLDECIRIETEVVQRVDHVVAQCPNEWSELVNDYDADPHKLVLIPGAVNTSLFRPLPRMLARQSLGLESHELTPETQVLVYVGRLLPRKDIRTIIRALALLRTRLSQPVVLLVVGGETADANPAHTSEVAVLTQLAEQLGVGKQVIFVGHRSQEQLPFYYGASDVVVTTPWYEPFGLTVLEGMACGRPVIGSQVGGLAFTILDGQTGFLVPPQEPEALAQRLAFLLQKPELRDQLGQAARRRVEQEFTWALTARRFAALYQQLLVHTPVYSGSQKS
jgi:D-inositol-3-phosphate glycosyltransferase